MGNAPLEITESASSQVTDEPHLTASATSDYSTKGSLFDFGWPVGGVSRQFASHSVVNHGKGEYVRDGWIHTNTAESSFAILKRGITGIFHAVSKKHLPRYVGEFDFRWNTRKMNDGERTVAAIQGATGKRLMYRQPAVVMA